MKRVKYVSAVVAGACVIASSIGFTGAAHAMPVIGTENTDFLIFMGDSQQLTTTLVNPYSGFTLDIDRPVNLNNTSYDGLGGFDFLILSAEGDALFLNDGAGNPLVSNIEFIQAGPGADIINLADDTLTYGDVQISGAEGDDIIFTNVGNDFIEGFDGDDIIDGGPGNDLTDGGAGNDTLITSSGNDFVIGGAGIDTVISTLLFEDFSIEALSFDENSAFADNFNAFATSMDGLLFTALMSGDFIFVSQAEFFQFGDGAVLDLGTLEFVSEVPLPAAFPVFIAGLAGLGFARRKRRNP